MRGWAVQLSAYVSGTAQPLALQYLLLAATVAAFIGGVNILGGKGSVIGAAVGVLTVNFLNTGLVYEVVPSYVVQDLSRHFVTYRYHFPNLINFV